MYLYRPHNHRNAGSESPPIAILNPSALAMVLEHLPDVEDLKAAVTSHNIFYNAFTSHKNSICTTVLNNQIPPSRYIHAMMAHTVAKTDKFCIPDLGSVSLTEVKDHVAKLTEARDNPPHLVDPKTALQICRKDKKILELSGLIIDDCSRARRGRHLPLSKTMSRMPVSHSEQERIRQAVYLFDVLFKVCKRLHVDEDSQHGYRTRITELQRCLATQFLSPWEYLHVLAVSFRLRLTLTGFESFFTQNPDLRGAILGGSPDFVSTFRVKEFLALREANLLFVETEARGLRAFDLVLSRAVRDPSTRQAPREYEWYKPFYKHDRKAYETWKRLEVRQARYANLDPHFMDLYHVEAALLESRLDRWGASLWDPQRWGMIEESINTPPTPVFWGSESETVEGTMRDEAEALLWFFRLGPQLDD